MSLLVDPIGAHRNWLVPVADRGAHMSTNRREVLEATLALAVRAAVGGSMAMALSSCGGGSSASMPAPTTVSHSIPAPSNLSYSTPLTATVGTAISQLTPSVSGNVASYSVNPALPAGLTIDTTTGVINGTPTAAASQATYTIIASNSGGETSFAISITVLGSLLISSVSNETPTALTPVTLVMQGLDPTQPFTVNLSNGADVNATIPAVRIASDGSAIVIAAPLYIDPNSGTTSDLSASVSVSQGSQTSGSVQLNISDMPTVASYGVNPGDISRGFLNQLALGFALNFNALQAVAALPSAAIDTSTVRGNLLRQQITALEARDNIDLLLTGVQRNISLGTSSSGVSVEFNSYSIDAMDRVLGMYLQYLRLIPSSIYAPLSSASSAALKRDKPSEPAREAIRMPRLHVRRSPSVNDNGTTSPVASGGTSQIPSNVISNLGTTSNAMADTTAGIMAAATQSSLDEFSAIGSGVSEGITIAGALTGDPAIVAAGVVVGGVVSLAAIANDVYKWHTASQAINQALDSGNSVALEQANLQQAAAEVQLTLDLVGTFAGLPFQSEDANALGIGLQAMSTFSNAVSASPCGSGGQAFQGGAFITGAAALLSGTSPTPGDADQQAVTDSNGDIPPGGGSFGLIDGKVIVQNTASPDLQPLNGVQLSDPVTGDTFQAIAGTDGGYQIIVPLNVPGMGYSQMQLQPFDPISSVNTGCQSGSFKSTGPKVTVDLSGLSGGSAQSEPLVSGSCNDNDASAPDQDDPDCD